MCGHNIKTWNTALCLLTLQTSQHHHPTIKDTQRSTPPPPLPHPPTKKRWQPSGWYKSLSGDWWDHRPEHTGWHSDGRRCPRGPSPRGTADQLHQCKLLSQPAKQWDSPLITIAHDVMCPPGYEWQLLEGIKRFGETLGLRGGNQSGQLQWHHCDQCSELPGRPGADGNQYGGGRSGASTHHTSVNGTRRRGDDAHFSVARKNTDATAVW